MSYTPEEHCHYIVGLGYNSNYMYNATWNFKSQLIFFMPEDSYFYPFYMKSIHCKINITQKCVT